VGINENEIACRMWTATHSAGTIRLRWVPRESEADIPAVN
jgi:hypothetical protein